MPVNPVRTGTGGRTPLDHGADAHDRRRIWGICLFLGALTLAVFGQTIWFEFVNFDDIYYVYENPLVTTGLTLHGILQAFAHGSPANWDPLTIISHMADWQWYGPHAGGHHLTNVLLHTASVILLFLVLRGMTGAVWRSALVAALFAIHPLRVESVVWVTERKDTLSGLFFMLTLLAYVGYVNASKVQSPSAPARAAADKKSRVFYILTLICFMSGLMSKAMLVTLPFLLLVLDYWPLNRLAGRNPGAVRRLIVEKLPLLALSALSLVVTILAQGRSVRSADAIPFSVRTGNVALSYVTYIRQMIYPAKLVVFYPFPVHGTPAGIIIAALAVLCAVTTAVFIWRREHPWLLAGWLWYLGMLLPVIGPIQVGAQAHADRYTYLPQIGLYVALAWALPNLRAGGRGRIALWAGDGAVIAVLSVTTWNQTTYWRDSEALWRHTIACTTDNALAHNNYASTIASKGRIDEAINEYRTAVQIDPGYNDARNNLGQLLAQRGRVDEAIIQFQKALETQPGDGMLHYNLGAALVLRGRREEAIDQFRQALVIQPEDAETQDNLGMLLLQTGRRDEAISHFLQALRIQPDFARAQNNLARVAWAMATHPNPSLRNGPKALEIAELVSRLSGGNNPEHLSVLAAARAETGQFASAVATAQSALQLAEAQSNAPMMGALQAQLPLYQSNHPYHQTLETNAGPSR